MWIQRRGEKEAARQLDERRKWSPTDTRLSVNFRRILHAPHTKSQWLLSRDASMPACDTHVRREKGCCNYLAG